MVRIVAVLAALLLAAGCNIGPSDEDRARMAAERAEADRGHIARAEELMRERTGDGEATFAEIQSYDHDGTNVVCGRVTHSGAQEGERFIVQGGEEVTIKSETGAAEMDAAATRLCQNYSSMSSDDGPSLTDMDIE